MYRTGLLLTAVAAVTLTTSAGAAEIFSYNSDSCVTADKTFARTPATPASAPYEYIEGFSTAPLSPASDYAGPTFYGGYQYTNTAVKDGFSRQQVRNRTGGTPDEIIWQVYASADEYQDTNLSFHAVVLFDQAAFAPGFDSGQIGLDGLSIVTQGGSGTPDFAAELRFVVQQNGVYYVSDFSATPSGTNVANSLTGTDFANAQWATYDPASSLNFEQTGSFQPMTFNDIQAVGFYFEDDAFSASANYVGPVLDIATRQFSATGTVIPEPASLLLAGMGAMLMLGRRRVARG